MKRKVGLHLIFRFSVDDYLHGILQSGVGKVVVHCKDDICVVAGAGAAEHGGGNFHRLANVRPQVQHWTTGGEHPVSI